MSILEKMIRNRYKNSLSPPTFLNSLYLVSMKNKPDIKKRRQTLSLKEDNRNIKNLIFVALDNLSERKRKKRKIFTIKNGKIIQRKESIFHVTKEKKQPKFTPIKSIESITKYQKTFLPKIKKHKALNNYLIRDFKGNEENYDYIRTVKKNQMLSDEFYSLRQLKIQKQTALNIAKFERRKNKELFETDINNEQEVDISNSELNDYEEDIEIEKEEEKEEEKENEEENEEEKKEENDKSSEENNTEEEYDIIDNRNFKTINNYSFKSRNKNISFNPSLTSSESLYLTEKRKLNELNLKKAEIRGKTLSKQLLHLNTDDLIDIENQHEYIGKKIDLSKNPFFQDSNIQINDLPEEPESHQPKLIEPNLLHEVNLKKILRQSKNKINIIKEGDDDLGLDNIENVRKERKDIEYQFFKVLKDQRTPKFLKNNFNLSTVKRFKGVSGKYFGVAC